jgi:hypothetical protein
MPGDAVLLRSARNAFLALLFVLIGVSSYQFLTIQRVSAEIAAVWVTGAGAFYLSKWYYGRNPEPLRPEAPEPEEEN